MADLSLAFTTWVNHPGTPSTPGAADLNRIQDALRFLAAPPAVSAHRSFDQAVSHSTETPVRFDVTQLNRDGMHSTGTDVASRITINTSGWYVVTGAVVWDAPPNSAEPVGFRGLRIKRNGQDNLARVDHPPVPHTNVSTGQQIEVFYPLSAGQYIELVLVHTQGSTLTVSGGGTTAARLQARWDSPL